MSSQLFLGSNHVHERAAGCVLAIGNFDGVHLGHQAVLGELRNQAKALGRATMVYTFHPLPQAVLRPQERYPRILSLEDRVAILGSLGIDFVCIERFTSAYSRHTADWFLDVVLAARIRPSALVVGHDFQFGHRSRGNLDAVTARLPSLRVTRCEAFTQLGRVVSSSRIRELVSLGGVEEASRLLGRPHTLKGTVVEGFRRGRGLGFPTANLEPETELLPPPGVYAALARVDGGPPLLAATAVGHRPTFGRMPFSIETHILDLPDALAGRDLYGHEFEIELHARIRDELRFDSVEALVARMREDIAEVRRLAALRGNGEGAD
jgi:riboflavin kinase/FMN adenylyltransferase